MDDQKTKACAMCDMQLSAKAKKCPYCHHFQNKFTLLMYNPLFTGSLYLVAVLVMVNSMTNIFKSEDDLYRDCASQLHVLDSKLFFGETKCGDTVSVIGTITNQGVVSAQDVVVQADFMDGSGNRVDAGQRTDWKLYVPANASIPFKVTFAREFPKTNYVRHAISVIGAKDARNKF